MLPTCMKTLSGTEFLTHFDSAKQLQLNDAYLENNSSQTEAKHTQDKFPALVLLHTSKVSDGVELKE